MLFALVFAGALLALYIYLNANGEDLLTEYCNGTGYFKDASSLTDYDNVIKEINTGLCSTCTCQLPGAANYDVKYKPHDGTTETVISAVTYTANGVKNIKECSAIYDTYSTTLKALISIMATLEEKQNCGGICIQANIQPSFDLTAV